MISGATLLPLRGLGLLALGLLGLLSRAGAGTATNIYGLYYTGVESNYGLTTQGTQDAHWDVFYASTNGGSSENATYEGSAYVVNSQYVNANWIQNTSTAQWITAPGAVTSSWGGGANTGGLYLPGNGNYGGNEGLYAYVLAFTIVGSGSSGSTVTNAISISITLAADDQYQVYVNPQLSNSQMAGSGTSSWTNTTSLTLTNTGANANSTFVIGTNYLTVFVENTNSINGNSNSTALNPSGLLVYEVGGAVTIDGKVIPETGTWLPLAAAVGLLLWRRRRDSILQQALVD